MKSHGFVRYAIDAIKYDKADIAERQKTQRVAELAESRKAFSINPVTVGPEGVLVAGRDRLAADLLNGAREVWAHVVVECSEADLLRIEVEENVRRRDVDRNRELGRLVKAIEQEKAGAPPANSTEKRKPGRPVTPKGEARREAAKAAGTTPEAVRRAEQRAAEREAPEAPAEKGPALHLFGLPREGRIAEIDGVAEAHQQQIDELANALEQAQKWLNKAVAVEQRVSNEATARRQTFLVEADRLHDQVQRLAVKARAARPKALCYFGKGACSADCAICGGIGYAMAGQMGASQVPAELLREGAAAMVSDGRGGFRKFDVSTNGGLDRKAATQPVRTPSRAPASKPSPAKAESGVSDQGAAATAGNGPACVSDRQDGRTTSTPPPPKSPKSPKRMLVETADGRVVDPTRPPEDLAYSGREAPPADLPELVVERDEAVGDVVDPSEMWT